MADQGVDTLLLSVGADLPYFCGYQAMPLERLTLLVVVGAALGPGRRLGSGALREPLRRRAEGRTGSRDTYRVPFARLAPRGPRSLLALPLTLLLPGLSEEVPTLPLSLYSHTRVT